MPMPAKGVTFFLFFYFYSFYEHFTLAKAFRETQLILASNDFCSYSLPCLQNCFRLDQKVLFGLQKLSMCQGTGSLGSCSCTTSTHKQGLGQAVLMRSCSPFT